MVEKTSTYILEQNNPYSIIQEMTYLICTEEKKIIGVRIKCKDKTISFPTDPKAFEEKKKTEEIIKF